MTIFSHTGDDACYIIQFLPIAIPRPMTFALRQELLIAKALVMDRVKKVFHIPFENPQPIPNIATPLGTDRTQE